MANRRISELPLLDGTQVAEQDLFTMVHVFEVDPTLKNKKITVSGLKQYLDSYYLTASGSTVYGSLVVQNNLTTSGLIVSNLSTLSAVIVQNNLTTSGAISGATVTGNTGQFTTITGGIVNFTSVTGITVTAATGIFATLIFANITVSGDLNVLGSGYFSSGVNISGTLSGVTITGTTAQFTSITGSTAGFTTVTGTTVTGTNARFTNITGTTLHVTTPSGATPAIICSGVVSGSTAGFIIQGPLIILP